MGKKQQKVDFIISKTLGSLLGLMAHWGKYNDKMLAFNPQDHSFDLASF